MESENFRAFPTVGQISESGYVLIAPKEHLPSFGALDESLFEELNDLKDRLDTKTTQEYEKPMFLEHGMIGQTIAHAHIHSVPVPEGKDWEVYNKYSKDLPSRHVKGVGELPVIWKENGHYLYLEMKNGESFAFYTPVVPMYGRIIVADVLEVPERADWKTMNREVDDRLIQETLKKLRD